jgi:hypothetical protein
MRTPSDDDPSALPEAAAAGLGSDGLISDRRLRAACRLTLDVVRAGELADPPIAAPQALHKVLGFRRLSGVAYETVVRAVNDHPDLRDRVAAEANEASVGGAGWLWLHRPDGWATDPAWLAEEVANDDDDPGAAGVGGIRRNRAKGKARTETELAQRRREAEEARAGQREARKELAQARRDLAAALAGQSELVARMAVLGEERNQAVRAAKATEADLAAARRSLKLAKETTIDAEAELAAMRAGGADPAAPRITTTAPGAPGSAAATPASTSFAPPVAATGPAIDAASASTAVAAAASAAADLGVALARAASALEPKAPTAPAAPARPGASDEPQSDLQGRRRVGPKGRGRRVAHRAVAPLPPGLFDGTPEANRHLVAAGDALLVVDGYNLARTTWTDLTPREDRQRVVTMLEAVQARSSGVVIVVFDGESGTVAPRHSRAVRVVFSATGVTADDHIADLVASLPPERPVVVVSSDRAVMADARRHGATAMTSPAFLAAAGR